MGYSETIVAEKHSRNLLQLFGEEVMMARARLVVRELDGFKNYIKDKVTRHLLCRKWY
jgi:hypothetical protein